MGSSLDMPGFGTQFSLTTNLKRVSLHGPRSGFRVPMFNVWLYLRENIREKNGQRRVCRVSAVLFKVNQNFLTIFLFLNQVLLGNGSIVFSATRLLYFVKTPNQNQDQPTPITSNPLFPKNSTSRRRILNFQPGVSHQNPLSFLAIIHTTHSYTALPTRRCCAFIRSQVIIPRAGSSTAVPPIINPRVTEDATYGWARRMSKSIASLAIFDPVVELLITAINTGLVAFSSWLKLNIGRDMNRMRHELCTTWPSGY